MPGFFDMIGRLFLTLRRDPACQKQVQDYSELVGSVLWDVWHDAEMSAALAHHEAPKAPSLTSQNVTGSNVSDRFSSSAVVHNMGIDSPFSSVKIVSASALSLEQEGRWREGLQCALLTAVSPANVGSVASTIVALDMQLGITVIQVWRCSCKPFILNNPILIFVKDLLLCNYPTLRKKPYAVAKPKILRPLATCWIFC